MGTILLAEPKLMSIDQFVADSDNSGYELVEGVPTERKEAGALSDHSAVQIGYRLCKFCEEHDAGYVFGSKTIYCCFDHPNTGRRADVSFIRRGRLPGERIPEGSIDIPADLAVEVVSPNDLAYDVEAKVGLYLRFGFGEVWVVYPNLRTVHMCRKGQAILSLDADQTITGTGPLEGFSCPVSRFFPTA